MWKESGFGFCFSGQHLGSWGTKHEKNGGKAKKRVDFQTRAFGC